MMSDDDDCYSDEGLAPIGDAVSLSESKNSGDDLSDIGSSISSSEDEERVFVKSELKKLKKTKKKKKKHKHKHSEKRKRHHHHHHHKNHRHRGGDDEEEEEETAEAEDEANSVLVNKRRRDRRRTYYPQYPVMETGEQLMHLRLYDEVNGRKSEREIDIPMGFYYCSKKASDPPMDPGYRAGVRLNSIWNECDTGLLTVKKFKGRVKQSKRLPLRTLPRFNVDKNKTSPEAIRKIYYGDNIQYVVSFRDLPDVFAKISDTVCILTPKDEVIEQMREFLENWGRSEETNAIREEELEEVNMRTLDPKWGEVTNEAAVVMIRRHQETQDEQFTGLLESVTGIKEAMDAGMRSMEQHQDHQFMSLARVIKDISNKVNFLMRQHGASSPFDVAASPDICSGSPGDIAQRGDFEADEDLEETRRFETRKRQKIAANHNVPNDDDE